MKLVSYSAGDRVESGVVVDGDLVAGLPSLHGLDASVPSTVIGLLEAGPEGLRLATLAAEGLARKETLPGLSSLRLAPPVPNPSKVVCVAGNNADHLAEWGIDGYDRNRKGSPWLFLRPPGSLAAASSQLFIPAEMGEPGWELELAAIVGRRGFRLDPACAIEHVAGYAIFNDMYAADLRVPRGYGDDEWSRFFAWYEGHCFDGTAPCGPFFVTRDEVPDPHDLRIQLKVNGEPRLETHTGQMLFSVAECIAFISNFMELRPGDVVSLGACGETGHGSRSFLRNGDVIEAEIDGLGIQRNEIFLTG